MAVERTLAIIKPDAVQKGVIGEVIQKMEEANLKPVGIKMLQLTKDRVEGFYAVHKDRPFFGDLVKFMASGPVVVFCLEGTNAIANWRKVMGATNPDQAEAGTIRQDYGTDIQCNAVHGSDSPQTAAFEVGYFFEAAELVTYDWM